MGAKHIFRGSKPGSPLSSWVCRASQCLPLRLVSSFLCVKEISAWYTASTQQVATPAVIFVPLAVTLCPKILLETSHASG